MTQRVSDAKLKEDELKIKIHRRWVADDADTEDKLVWHRERAKLLDALGEALDMEVRDWGNTDSYEYHETVEIITALGSAGVFTAIAYVLVSWIRARKIKSWEITRPDGTAMTVENISEKTFNMTFNKMIEERCQKLE